MNDTKDIIEIEYCVSCDYRARALWIATELLASFQFDIEAIVLKGARR